MILVDRNSIIFEVVKNMISLNVHMSISDIELKHVLFCDLLFGTALKVLQ